ncbi:hypothetical protein ACQB6R_10470 [Propionibacteriaceae bacterium G1746]|uniref:hypothetical protein n=1 Tax=Aestuariimicrobium sp. G57 TaxID=3418485 RepID=UPI003C27BB69
MTSRTRRPAPIMGAVAMVALSGLVLSGCAAADSQATSSTHAVATSAPAGGQLLRERGIVHGPAGFSLPARVTPTRVIDQPNVVTLVFRPDDAQAVLDWLLTHGAGMGIQGVETGNGSMVFTVQGWDGGFTTSTEIAGLTLRRQQ